MPKGVRTYLRRIGDAGPQTQRGKSQFRGGYYSGATAEQKDGGCCVGIDEISQAEQENDDEFDRGERKDEERAGEPTWWCEIAPTIKKRRHPIIVPSN
jgi:hypothetical protein